MVERLENKVAILFGAGSVGPGWGNGKATAVLFARNGAHAASVLGVYALTAVAPIAPGSPLCRAHSSDPVLAGLEIALKGGQVGRPDFFCAVKAGGTA